MFQPVTSSDYLFVNWSVAALELWSFYQPESLTDANLYELDLEANPYQPEQKPFLPGQVIDPGVVTTPAPAENSQSLVNASVSQVFLQDEISVCLKRAVEKSVIVSHNTLFCLYFVFHPSMLYSALFSQPM